MKTMHLKLVITTISLFYSTSLFAAKGPSAIIEDIQGADSALAFMDYVSENEVIKLGKTGKLVIGYLSCRRETITGGTVTVGSVQSHVEKGQVLSEDVECDGGQARLTGQQAASSAALAFRGTKKSIGLGKADITIFGTSPVLRLKQPGADVTIERIDQHDTPQRIRLEGRHLDLADKKLVLAAGGLYKVSLDTGMSKTFKVDKYALDGKIAIVSRLIEL